MNTTLCQALLLVSRALSTACGVGFTPASHTRGEPEAHRTEVSCSELSRCGGASLKPAAPCAEALLPPSPCLTCPCLQPQWMLL